MFWFDRFVLYVYHVATYFFVCVYSQVVYSFYRVGQNFWRLRFQTPEFQWRNIQLTTTGWTGLNSTNVLVVDLQLRILDWLPPSWCVGRQKWDVWGQEASLSPHLSCMFHWFVIFHRQQKILTDQLRKTKNYMLQNQMETMAHRIFTLFSAVGTLNLKEHSLVVENRC